MSKKLNHYNLFYLEVIKNLKLILFITIYVMLGTRFLNSVSDNVK